MTEITSLIQLVASSPRLLHAACFRVALLADADLQIARGRRLPFKRDAWLERHSSRLHILFTETDGVIVLDK
jgi:hypothetical protein